MRPWNGYQDRPRVCADEERLGKRCPLQLKMVKDGRPRVCADKERLGKRCPLQLKTVKDSANLYQGSGTCPLKLFKSRHKMAADHVRYMAPGW